MPGRIAVHDGAAYRALLAGQHWSSLQIEGLPSGYPLFARPCRWLMRTPAIGGLFRFRIP